MEKIWPAPEHVDSSSGALGSAVNKTLDDLIPIVVNAPADEKTRDEWLDRLWQAMADDGVDYLSPVGDRWGELCGSTEVAGRWADELVSTLRSCWTDPSPGGYFHGATACLSCLLATGRHEELLDLLELPRYPSWHWLSEGWGYEVTSIDVVEAYERAIDAAARLKKVDNVNERIRQLVEASDSASVQFVRKAVQGRMRACATARTSG